MVPTQSSSHNLTHIIETTIGGQDVLIEAVDYRPSGTQKTAVGSRAATRVENAFDQMRSVMEAAASEIGGMLDNLDADLPQPAEVTVEMGLKISTTGRAIVVSGTAEATLKVSFTFRPAVSFATSDGAR